MSNILHRMEEWQKGCSPSVLPPTRVLNKHATFVDKYGMELVAGTWFQVPLCICICVFVFVYLYFCICSCVFVFLYLCICICYLYLYLCSHQSTLLMSGPIFRSAKTTIVSIAKTTLSVVQRQLLSFVQRRLLSVVQRVLLSAVH